MYVSLKEGGGGGFRTTSMASCIRSRSPDTVAKSWAVVLQVNC